MHLSSVMAMRATSCGGNVHRGAFLFAAPPPISTHRQNKKGAFFAPKNLSLFPSLNWEKRRSRIIGCCPRVHRVEGEAIEELEEFLVVSFYKFVLIKDPEAEVSKHQAFLEERDIHGRIYVNEQGINAQFEGGTLHLPLLDPSMRATPLPPSEWRKRLEVANEDDMQSEKENFVHNRKFLLLDVRNGYEWDIGHFKGAHRPNVDCFRGTSFGFSAQENQVSDSDPLAGIDKENTDILMYCTGGIRCDVYSTILRQRGFQNLYTLSGGVSNYLQSEGSDKWIGNLFVFDSRLSLPPSTYKSEENEEKGLEIGYQNEQILEMVYHNSTFARCYICSSRLVEFRHRNCANLDCNRLFLCCTNCVQELRGCCCSDCTNSSRLRPVLQGSQRYQKWHVYRDEVFRQ
ncbi:rhodanese-like domain-containing protein 8, chloroplastic isoform X3 [Asparagus officinalis]|uniref:rhodanese-like domain-containing protein 8, chloroplastic isoform X3 n=1 Tax=Asparagus officinalis TaxID=4686 RepID=UPI00098E696C|nr:rhodanese-like domain-containing protein 8, chloroplastic isoform X3 [Asparagus officinalis]